MKSIIYTSRVADGIECEASLLSDVLQQAQSANPALGVTGAMIMSDRRFLQIIEGEEEAVEALYCRIARDARHGDLDVLYREQIRSRSFANWSMQGFEVAPAANFDAQTIASVRNLFDQSFTYRADVFLTMLRSVFARAEFAARVVKAA